MIDGPDSLQKTPSTVHRKDNDKWLLYALLLVISLAPLPLGSNRPLPAAILVFCLATLLAVWATMFMMSKTSLNSHYKALTVPALLFGIVCIWIAIQWAPLGLAISDPIWIEASKQLGMELTPRLTVNPQATLTGLSHLLAYGIVFWLSFHLAHTSTRAWLTIRILAFVGAIYATYGIIVFISGNAWILIYPKWAYQDSLTSVFVNRNSYATFAGLSLLCAVTMTLARIEDFLVLKHNWRSKTLFIAEELFSKSAWKLYTVIAIAISLTLSGSRAGITSSFLGLLSIVVIFFLQNKIRRQTQIWFAVGGVASILLLAFVVGGTLLKQRLELNHLESSLSIRTDMYAKTIDAITTAPLTGTGFGTYSDVITAYKSGGKNSALEMWDKAHNTYLENALELGLPGAILLNLSIIWLAAYCVRGARTRRQNKLLPALGVGTSILVGCHSLVDFSLQIPAVAVLYAAILGVATAQSWRSSANTNPADR